MSKSDDARRYSREHRDFVALTVLHAALIGHAIVNQDRSDAVIDRPVLAKFAYQMADAMEYAAGKKR